MDGFPEIGLVHDRKIEISKKGWVFQQSVGVTTRENEIKEKYFDEFSRIYQ